MHFRSQPHHADEHAMRRKKERGYAFLLLLQWYSAALIILGASYKMLLYEFMYEDYGGEKDDGHRMLFFSMPRRTILHRWLAGGGGGALNFDKDDRQQRVANLFCGSLAAVFLLSDLLIVIHKGFKEHMEHCKKSEAPKITKLIGSVLLIIRIGVVAFMASLSQYETDGTLLSFLGLIAIFVSVSVRIVGSAMFREETEEDEALQEIMNHGVPAE